MSSQEEQNQEELSSITPTPKSSPPPQTNSEKKKIVNSAENVQIISEQREHINIDKLVLDFQNSALSTLNLALVFSVAFLISFFYRRILQPFVEKTNLKHSYSMAEESRIESILAQVMAITRSDRVILFEFHNGETSKGGRHLNKISATQEITGPGLTKISYRYQGLLISNLHTFLARLEQEEYLHTDVDLIKDAFCKSEFIGHGVEYCITRGYFEGGVPLAIIQMQFCRNQREDFDNFKPKEIDKLLSELGSLVRREKETWLGEMFKLFSRRLM